MITKSVSSITYPIRNDSGPVSTSQSSLGDAEDSCDKVIYVTEGSASC